ncbi:hypothetical protein EUGRSUZ_G02337 [Eucalyptus grandis]|uniref:Uncharacterized protein n=2 Tax=Eucalyptus grandis TaxID=71139 RepID=A0ACC3K6Z6_EUCGR|nr:hypothetical protein EUGRSUZ_G02337 [Eucalyptus grandis]
MSLVTKVGLFPQSATKVQRGHMRSIYLKSQQYSKFKSSCSHCVYPRTQLAQTEITAALETKVQMGFQLRTMHTSQISTHIMRRILSFMQRE